MELMGRSVKAKTKLYFIKWICIGVVDFLFKLFDSNGDGRIDFEEFKTIYHVYGIDDKQIMYAFKQLDTNSDGVLSLLLK